MPTILSAALKIYSSIAGFVLPMCAAALIGLWISDRVEIHSLNGQLAQSVTTITGLHSQIDRMADNLAIAHANGDTLAKALADADAVTGAWKAAADAASQRASLALSKANADSIKSEVRIAALLNAKAGESVCTSALDLIQMAGAP